MQTVRLVGVLLSAVGVAGYVAGVLFPYPGRAFSLTGVMLGVTLFAVGGEPG